ncbi:hemolysin family protein [Mycoplasmopsis columboralis]|uniref:Mg2+ and Co2+ transporter CorB n=1 Tax=Mycoplasmopsis columboralis TaxID=171282 RepID=A0A449B6H2_9BACT|nr:hemolysin family protein [Mycoplasmopsis columboralis]VEU76179.1 Putative Mg2+ and Co2+ transporter CorB [Mycoplasmopsis columboralis]
MSLGLLIGLSIVLFILFLLSAIFSGSETAYSTISVAKINHMVEEKVRNANLIQKQRSKFNQILGTILIGNNIVNVGSSVLTSFLLGLAFDSNSVWPTVISIAIVTPILLIFGEIGPKLIAKHNPEKYLQVFAPFIEVMYWFLWILTLPISKIGKELLVTHTEDELKTMINLAQNEGVLQTAESILVKNALDLDSTKVQQHYVRLKDVSYLDYRDNVAKAHQLFKETNYSRLPIMKNDNLIGMVMLKDIFHLKRGKVINYMQTVPYISVNSLLSSALDKLRKARAQMAFVVENNNSTKVKGIITIEDILEEIVGEIYDEHDDDEEIYELSLEKSQVQAELYVYDVFKQLDIEVSLLNEDEEELTLEQYLLKKTGDKKLYKKTSFVLDEKYQFKVISIAKDKKSHSIIEINKL